MTYKMVHEGLKTANKAIDLANRIDNTLQETLSNTISSATSRLYEE